MKATSALFDQNTLDQLRRSEQDRQKALVGDSPAAAKSAPAAIGARGQPDYESTLMGAAEYGAYSARKAFWGGYGDMQEANYALAHGEPGPVALLRLFLPREMVDRVSRLVGGNGKTVPMREYIMEEHGVGDSNAPTPTAAGKLITGPLGGALGDPTSYLAGPLLGPVTGGAREVAGTIAKSIVQNAGAREGAEIGGLAGGEPGAVVGGIVGGSANIMRAEGMYHGARLAGKTTKTLVGGVGKARDEAKRDRARLQAEADAARARGETPPPVPSTFALFADKYRDLARSTVGMADRVVRGRIQQALDANPYVVKNSVEFDEAARRLELDKRGPNGKRPSDAFSLAEQTKDPTLLETQRERQSRTAEETRDLTERQRAKEQVIGGAFAETARKMGVDGKPTPMMLYNAAQNARRRAWVRVKAMEGRLDAVKAQTPALTPEGRKSVGETLHALYDDERKTAQKLFDERYDALLKNTRDANGLPLTADVSGIGAEAKALVGEIANQVNKQNVPAPIQRLAQLFGLEGEQGAKYSGAGFTQDITAVEPKSQRVSLADLHKIQSDLRESAEDAAHSGNSEAARNLWTIREAVQGLIEKDPVIGAQYRAVSSDYRTQFVPRFITGVNANLNRKAGMARPNEERLRPELIAGEFIRPPKGANATTMEQFNNLFGGKIPGTVRNQQAYQALAVALEDDFNKHVLNREGGFNERVYTQYLRDMGPVLRELPGEAAKLEKIANEVEWRQNAIAREEGRVKKMLGGPLHSEFTPEQADQLFAKALADPKNMAALVKNLDARGQRRLIEEIMTTANPFRDDGAAYDAKTLLAVLNAGVGPNRMSGMQLLFAKVYGAKRGGEFIDDLRAIGELAEREALGRPNSLRPTESFSSDTLQVKTGQNPASWAAIIKSMAEHRISSTFGTVISGTRLANARLRIALENAEHRALYDPEFASAVRAAYSTDSRDPIARAAMEKILEPLGAEGKRIIKDMINHGYITPTVVRGAQIGVKHYSEDQDAAQARQ